MKLAITGKGGVGKTTVTAGLALTISKDKKRVTVIDCDPDANLGLSLGFANSEAITPISELKSLIAQRTEVESLDAPTTFFKLNPQVDDIPDKYNLVIKPSFKSAVPDVGLCMFFKLSAIPIDFPFNSFLQFCPRFK